MFETLNQKCTYSPIPGVANKANIISSYRIIYLNEFMDIQCAH